MSRPYNLRSVIEPTAENEDKLAELIATAFADLPASRYLVDDEAQRQLVLARTFRNDLQDVRESGSGMIKTFAGLEACAVWVYHDGRQKSEPEFDERLQQAAGRWAPRFHAFYTALDAHRREVLGSRPHWHLWVLAVHPDQQRQGLGKILLVDRIIAFDVLDMPIYLEAATEELAEIYSRYGFKDAGRPIELGDGRTRMFPMVREPDPTYL